MSEEEKKIQPYYRAQAKRLVDCLFDKGYFADDLSRDGMNDVEELLGYFFQVTAESAAKSAVMAKKFKQTISNRPTPEERQDDRQRQIEKRFTHHPPKEGQPERYEVIREEAKRLAYLIVEKTPPSREQSLALTRLEEVVFHANAAIARNE